METKSLIKVILGGAAGLAVILGAASCVPSHRRPHAPPSPYMQPRHEAPYAHPPQRVAPPSHREQYTPPRPMPQRPMPPGPHR